MTIPNMFTRDKICKYLIQFPVGAIGLNDTISIRATQMVGIEGYVMIGREFSANPNGVSNSRTQISQGGVYTATYPNNLFIVFISISDSATF